MFLAEGEGFEPPCPHGPSVFETVPISRSGSLPLLWYLRLGSNQRPTLYRNAALPLSYSGMKLAPILHTRLAGTPLSRMSAKECAVSRYWQDATPARTPALELPGACRFSRKILAADL